MTYTLVAHDAERRRMLFGIASRWPSVGGVVPCFRPGVGLVCTQHYADGRLARRILDGMQTADLEAAVHAGLADFQREVRQVIAVACSGETYVWTGQDVSPVSGVARAPGVVCAGNMLASEDVADAVVTGYLEAAHLAAPERLIAALRAGERAGGDRRGREAAAIRVWPLDGPDDDPLPLDLRADEDADPLAVLERALTRRREVDY